MVDTLPTVWQAEAHTLAKHGILKTYLEAWVAIFSRSRWNAAEELLFVDGFAGPGEYTNGELGSPLVAINAIADHGAALTRPVRMKFIETNEERWTHLRQKLNDMGSGVTLSSRLRIDSPILGDCNEEIRHMISSRLSEGQPVGPALFFLDQFGYSQVPIDLVELILSQDKCEVFSYMNFLRLNQFLSDSTKWIGITAAYGDESWKGALDIEGGGREEFLRDTYINAMRTRGSAKHVWSFAMFNDTGRLLHWLIFATNNLRGLEEMKKAMWRVDGMGTYRFSDRDDPNQQVFLSGFDDEWLAHELFCRLKGRSLSETQLQEYVLTETPCYKFKNAINMLRRKGCARPEKGWPVIFTETVDGPPASLFENLDQ